jgi:hypothetical protein
MRKTIPKAELEQAFSRALKAIRSHKGKRISLAKAFDLCLTAMSTRPVKIVHVPCA